jgi:hypothetical protein
MRLEKVEAIVMRSVNQRWTDNSMAKSLMTRRQTMVLKTLHRKLNIEQHECH